MRYVAHMITESKPKPPELQSIEDKGGWDISTREISGTDHDDNPISNHHTRFSFDGAEDFIQPPAPLADEIASGIPHVSLTIHSGGQQCRICTEYPLSETHAE